MADLALVNFVNRDHFGFVSRSPQLGLLYVGTAARDAGHHVEIFAGDAPRRDLQGFLKRANLPVVGFYTNSDNIFDVHRLCQWLKQLDPSVRTILGGPLANVTDRELIEHPGVDMVCRGDGEGLICEVLAALDGNRDMAAIRGLTFRTPAGEVVRNDDRPTLFELDLLPIPDRSLYPNGEDGEGVRSQLVTSRGCGFRCTFCFESINRKYRAHSPERVVDEIKGLQDRYGTQYFTILDDVLTTDHRRLRKLCEAFVRELRPNKDFFFYCEGRVDSLCKFPDLLPMMREAGLTRLQIGSESGSQEVIDAYKKQITVDQIRRAVKACADADVLSIYTNVIVGGALETPETLRQTEALIEDLYDLAPGRIEVGRTFLSPYPGTDIRNNPERYKVRFLDPDFVTGVSDDYIFAETEALSALDILEASRRFQRTVHARMAEQVATMPAELVLRHLTMTTRGLLTRWAEHLRSDPILTAAARFVTNGYTVSPDWDSPDLWDRYLPARTFGLQDWHRSAVTWNTRRRTYPLDPQQLAVLAMLSGKNTLREILDWLVETTGGSSPPDQVANGLKAYLKSLSDELLIVFRDLGGECHDEKSEIHSAASIDRGARLNEGRSVALKLA